MCSQPAGDCAVKRTATTAKQRIPPLGEVLAVDLFNLNAYDRHFINTLLGEGEVSVRIQHVDGSESEIQEAIFCGLWRVRRRRGEQLLEDRLETGCAPLPLWQAATQNVLPTDSLLPPPIDGLMNGLPLAHELLAHVRNPDTQPHSINLTQLPISEADRLFLSRLCGEGNIQIRTIGYGESYINATGLRHVWHLRCTDTLKGPLLESYEICPIPEVVLAAPEDLADSAQRLGEVCQWLVENEQQ